jgi:hypothetical protein
MLARKELSHFAGVRTLLHRVRGYALMRQSQWDAARADFDESLRLARSAAAPYDVALALQARASLARATGGDPEPCLAESMPILERLGVTAMPRLDAAPSTRSEAAAAR